MTCALTRPRYVTALEPSVSLYLSHEQAAELRGRGCSLLSPHGHPIYVLASGQANLEVADKSITIRLHAKEGKCSTA